MILVYLSPNHWNSYSQRPHHFLSEVAGKFDHVVWINPYPVRLPKIGDFFHRDRPFAAAEGSPNMTVLTPTALPLEPLAWGRRINRWFFLRSVRDQIATIAKGRDITLAIGKPSDLALLLSEELKPALMLYDAMDDFPRFFSGRSRTAMEITEAEIARQADIILVSSHALRDKFLSLGHKPSLARNAFSPTTISATTRKQEKDAGKPGIFGYIGTIGSWFDWEGVVRMSEHSLMPEVHIVGPVLSPPPRRLPSNIKLFPAVPHREINHVLQTFDVGIIPFKMTSLTASVDPVKYYEYRAAGLPVLSSSFGEMPFHAADPGLFLYQNLDGEDIQASAAEYRETPDTLKKFRQENSWSTRFEGVARQLGHRHARATADDER